MGGCGALSRAIGGWQEVHVMCAWCVFVVCGCGCGVRVQGRRLRGRTGNNKVGEVWNRNLSCTYAAVCMNVHRLCNSHLIYI